MEPFIGQLLLAAWDYAPNGYAQCNGQALSINTYNQLYRVLGTAYGGDGRSNFKLPDLRGRTPIGTSNPTQVGQAGGAETHTLTPAEVPGSHTHALQGTAAAAGSFNPAGNAFATTTGSATLYGAAGNPAVLNGATISTIGGQPHENRQPFLVLNWCIALSGIYPERP
jgi:microcystin-dependent protein